MTFTMLPYTEQHIDAIAAFVRLFKHAQPKRIVELGSGNGVFTTHIALLGSFEVHTFDSGERLAWRMPVTLPNIQRYTMDVFKQLPLLSEIINRKGMTVVLCDNGDKPREVKMLANHLKPGDVIMVHDYFDVDVELKDQWTVCECQFSDIRDVIEPYYEDYHKQLMYPVRWGSWRKLNAEQKANATVTENSTVDSGSTGDAHGTTDRQEVQDSRATGQLSPDSGQEEKEYRISRFQSQSEWNPRA